MNEMTRQSTRTSAGMLLAMAVPKTTDNAKQDVDVVVVGLGKIGLPLAAHFAKKGLRVIGCDINPDVVAAVNAGRSHIREEPGLEEPAAEAVRATRLHATPHTKRA